MLVISKIVLVLCPLADAEVYFLLNEGEEEVNHVSRNHVCRLWVSTISGLIRREVVEIVPIVVPLNSTTRPHLLASMGGASED